MAKLPTFVFPQPERQDSAVPSSTPRVPAKAEDRLDTDKSSTTNSERPRLLVRTRSKEGQSGVGFRSSVPEISWTERPLPNGFCSTPPDSPVRARAYTMGADSKMDKRAFEAKPMSPPLTPTQPKHGSSNSDVSLKDLTKALPSQAGVPQPSTKDETNGILTFPYWETDYEILTVGPKAIKKVLGSGVWSDVYHALPTLPGPNPSVHDNTSRPITPRSRSSSASTAPYSNPPFAYAIKTPSSTAARAVLTQEARMLSHLSRQPQASHFIVPFYGQDPRSSALVLQLQDGTLESWITTTLNVLPEPQRAAKLAATFPAIARQLLLGIEWLKAEHCVHADIKPGNILVSSCPPPLPLRTRAPTSEEGKDDAPPQIFLTDFSSSILSTTTTSSSASDASSTTTAAALPLGGGTWDFLPPSAVHPSTRHLAPTPAHDLWGAAMTLLIVVVGASPFDFLGRSNVFQRREMVRQGRPVDYVGYGDFGVRNVARLKGLGRDLGEGVDLVGWFRRVLGKKGEEEEIGAREWLEGLGLELGS